MRVTILNDKLLEVLQVCLNILRQLRQKLGLLRLILLVVDGVHALGHVTQAVEDHGNTSTFQVGLASETYNVYQ